MKCRKKCRAIVWNNNDGDSSSYKDGLHIKESLLKKVITYRRIRKTKIKIFQQANILFNFYCNKKILWKDTNCFNEPENFTIIQKCLFVIFVIMWVFSS